MDVGTGAGNWLLDAAEYYQYHGPKHTINDRKVNFKGIDISTRCFPQTPSHLKSPSLFISFENASVLSLPPNWTNTFSLIHQRLFIAALRSHEWEKDISEMYRVLKPSGWLTVVEAGNVNAGPTTKKFMDVVNAFLTSKGLMHDCARKIPEMIRRCAGRHSYREVPIAVKIYQIPLGVDTFEGRDGEMKELASDAVNNFISMFRTLKVPESLMRELGVGMSYYDLTVAVEKEWKRTDDAHIELFVIAAKKYAEV